MVPESIDTGRSHTRYLKVSLEGWMTKGLHPFLVKGCRICLTVMLHCVYTIQQQRLNFTPLMLIQHRNVGPATPAI
jgi:hypothetical protein